MVAGAKQVNPQGRMCLVYFQTICMMTRTNYICKNMPYQQLQNSSASLLVHLTDC